MNGKKWFQCLSLLLSLLLLFAPTWAQEKRKTEERKKSVPSYFFGQADVNPQTGELALEFEKFASQKGFYPRLLLVYRSVEDRGKSLGTNWMTTGDIRLETTGAGYLFHRPESDQAIEFISFDDKRAFSQTGPRIELVKTKSGYTIAAQKGIQYHFSPEGKLTKISDSNGRFLQYFWNEKGQLVKIEDHCQRYLKFTYREDRWHKLSHFSGREVELKYNDQGLVEIIKDSQGQTISFAYDDLNRIISVNDKALSIDYTERGRVKEIKGKAFPRRSYAYKLPRENKGDMITEVTDARGQTTTFEYARHGSTLRIIDAAGRSRLMYLNPRKLPTMMVEPGERITRYRYDKNFNLKEIIDPGQRRFAFAYDERGNLISFTRPNGGQMKLSYDERHNLEKVQYPDGRSTSYQYGKLGRISKISTSWGYSLKIKHDSYGRVISQVDNTGWGESYKYDQQGRITQLTRGKMEWKYQYQSRGRHIKMKTNQGFSMDVFLNLLGKVDKVMGPRGRTTSYRYNPRGQIESIVYPDGNLAAYQYDSAGQLVKMTDPSGRSYHFAYDVLGRLTSLKDPLGRQTKFEYSESGRRSAKILADGRKIQYSYNDLGKVTQIKTPEDRSLFTYNKWGQMTSMKNSQASYNYEYDGSGRLVAVKDEVLGKTLHYGFNKLGLRSHLKGPFGQINYDYNQAGKLAKIVDPQGKAIRYGYSQRGLNNKIQFPNGVTTSFRYNPMGRLVHLLTKNKEGETLVKREYNHDILTKRKSVVNEKGEKEEFKYDARGRLVKVNGGESQINYNYDNIGNRVARRDRGMDGKNKEVYAYDSAGQLRLKGKVRYTYDKVGNLKEKIDPQGQRTRYHFNSLGKLTKVELPGGKVVEYGYAPNGARVWKKVNGEKTHYLYDLEDVVAEYKDGTLQASYIHGPGIDEPLAVNRKDEKRYFHLDGLSSVVAMTGAKGKVAARYQYGPFGRLLSQRGDSEKNPYRFTGRRYDSETNLYYHRARYYAPQLGRFISRDPLLFVDGPNLYTYCQNDPVNFVDPFGTWGLWEGFKNKVKSGVSAVGNGISSATKAVGRAGSWVADKAVDAKDWAVDKAVKTKDWVVDSSVQVARAARDAGEGALLLVGVGPEDEVNAFRQAFATSLADTFGGGYVATQISNFAVGVVGGVSNGVKGLVKSVLHPIETLEGVIHAVVNYDKTWEAVKHLWNEYTDAAANDPAKFARMTGNLVGELAFALVGDKGISKAVGKARTLARTAAKNRRLTRQLNQIQDKSRRASERVRKLRRQVKNTRHTKKGRGGRPKKSNLRKNRKKKLNGERKKILSNREARELNKLLEEFKNPPRTPREIASLHRRAKKLLKNRKIDVAEGFLEKLARKGVKGLTKEKIVSGLNKIPTVAMGFAALRRISNTLNKVNILKERQSLSNQMKNELGRLERELIEARDVVTNQVKKEIKGAHKKGAAALQWEEEQKKREEEMSRVLRDSLSSVVEADRTIVEIGGSKGFIDSLKKTGKDGGDE